MKNRSASKAFLEAFQLVPGKPATAKNLAKAETKLGSPLPESLRNLYESGDGGRAAGQSSALRLHSIDSALTYAGVPGFLDGCWALWPLVENDDSDPWCVFCRSPLAGYVVQIRHDDEPRLMFRSLDDFFRATADAADEHAFPDSDEITSQFDSLERKKSDLAAAEHLTKMALTDESLSEEERTDAACFACDLFGGDTDAIVRLLGVDNADVREHIMARLKRIPGENAEKAISRSADDFSTFVISCGMLLQSEGIAASVVEMHGKKTIRIDPGPIWLNMEQFFAARNRPDAEAVFLERIRALIRPKPKKKGKSK